MLIAPAAATALSDDDRFVARHIRKQASGREVSHQRSPRHLDNGGLPGPSAAPVAASVFPTLGCVFSLIAEIRQGGQVVVHLKNNVPTLAAISAVRAACRDIFFPVKGYRAVSTVARLYFNFRNIYKQNRTDLSF